MATLPHGWTAYGRFQTRLMRLSELSDYASGLEAVLNAILEPDFSPSIATEDDFRRVAASASRKERDHQARFHSELDDDATPQDPTDFVAMIEARASLSAIADEISETLDQRLIAELAMGRAYEEIAVRVDVPVSALRSRACRLRQKLAHLR